MCGIVGVVAPLGRFDRPAIERAVRALHHRGPDDAGVERLAVGEREVWLGHARLAIVDLSAAGHQPMIRPGRGAIVYNGEIYDHRVHRAALGREWEFASRSDTEVLLAGLSAQGPEFVARLNAQCAAAFVDLRRGELTLIRDRLGKKPLYVHREGEVLAFASEPKAFAALGLPLEPSEEGLAHYRWLGYLPATLSAYRRVTKLPAASTATVDLRAPVLAELAPRPYWDPLGGYATRFEGDAGDAEDALSELLDDATRIRLAADVPVGVFLSGGIDSSLVAASVARRHGDAVSAYVVRTEDARLDESERAARTAEVLGLPIQILHVRPADLRRQVDRAAELVDEPHAGMSWLGEMALAEQAKKHVTVVLTGDGGDETFLGYPWVSHPRRLRRLGHLVRAFPGAASLLRAVDRPTGHRALAPLVRAIGLNPKTVDTKLAIVRDAAAGAPPEVLYEPFQTLARRATLSASDRRILGDASLLERARAWYPTYSWEAAARTGEELLGALDLVTYLRDDVLVKVDRATMAWSIEARSPLLDHRLVELAASMPLDLKVRGGAHKWLLRRTAARRIDEAIATLPKHGFSIDEPAGMPAGATPSARWARYVEETWAARWTGRA